MPNKTQQLKKRKKPLWVDLGARGTPEENDTINQAAKLAKQSRCQFVLQAALERAALYPAETSSK